MAFLLLHNYTDFIFFKFYLTLNLLFIFYKEDQNPFNSENI